MAMTLLQTNAHTGNSDTVSTFNSSIDSTYKLYIFKFYDVNPATDDVNFTFQVNATDDPGGDYDVSLMTTTVFEAEHSEDDTTIAALAYEASDDQAQAAGFQILAEGIGNGGDESCAGQLFLFNPSNTTYVKHFYATTNAYRHSDSSRQTFVGGYINDTTAIDDIQFKMTSGNFDGTIKMYGVG